MLFSVHDVHLSYKLYFIGIEVVLREMTNFDIDNISTINFQVSYCHSANNFREHLTVLFMLKYLSC